VTIGPLTSGGTQIQVTCRRCGQQFSYAYPGRGPLRQYHHGEEGGGATNCRRAHSNSKAGRGEAQMVAAFREFRSRPSKVGDALLREAMGDEFDRIVRREKDREIRALFGTTTTLRRNAIVLSNGGVILDLPAGERRDLLQRIATAATAAGKLLDQTHARRQAHITLAAYRELMLTRMLPLLKEIDELFKKGR